MPIFGIINKSFPLLNFRKNCFTNFAVRGRTNFEDKNYRIHGRYRPISPICKFRRRKPTQFYFLSLIPGSAHIAERANIAEIA
jgi:hypothetical protein